MSDMTLPEALAEIERLRERLLVFETAAVMARGHLGAALLGENTPEPFSIEHNVPGNAPV